jgi:predicted dehydrogenase
VPFDPVRFALVGYGFGGRTFHAPFLASASECEFAGVVTTSPERRAQVATDHPGARVYDDLAAVVSDGVEAVAISTPAATHSALTDEALRLGLHVVCDKPFALDAAAAQRSVDLALETDRLLSPYQNRRWDSDFRTVRHLVDAGRLGTVTRFESRFERFKPDPGPKPAGGGTLLDLGSHLVDQALQLLGEVRTVYAEMTVLPSGLDDDVFIALSHTSGARSHLWCSARQPAPGPRFRVAGSAAAYVVEAALDGQEDRLRAGETPQTFGDTWGIEPESRWGYLRSGDEAEPIETLPGAWQTFYPAFATAVRGEGGVPVDREDAVLTAHVLDAARQSATTGTVIRLSQPEL